MHTDEAIEAIPHLLTIDGLSDFIEEVAAECLHHTHVSEENCDRPALLQNIALRIAALATSYAATC